MIGSLRGRVLEISPLFALVEAGGVGYRVTASPSVLTLVKTGDEAFFYVHDHIREDSHDLYGFLKSEDLALFERLLQISGVGPKVAMTILSVGSADTVRRAIMSGDIDTMTSVPGVGKKTAQKIILELKGQLVDAESQSPEEREVTEALQALGYSGQQAREALKNLGATKANTSDRVREALRFLSK